MSMTNGMLQDALRYMGVPAEKSDEQSVEKVKSTYNALENIAQPRSIYKRVPISIEGEEVVFENTSLRIQSSDLVKLLKHSKSCYIMGITLGKEVDRQIGIKQRLDMLEALMLDACASVLVEKVCDDIEQEMMESLGINEFLTMRFSPGYGDVPLSAQEGLLDLLEGSKKIGLNLTKTNMLLPTKSITAFIGVSHIKENRQKTCGACNLVKSCAYRKRGERCGL